MKVYPKGTVCTLIKTSEKYSRFLNRDVTVLQEEMLWEDGITAYGVEVQGEAGAYRAFHFSLRPKKFPPNAAFDSFFNKLLKPCDENILEEA